MAVEEYIELMKKKKEKEKEMNEISEKIAEMNKENPEEVDLAMKVVHIDEMESQMEELKERIDELENEKTNRKYNLSYLKDKLGLDVYDKVKVFKNEVNLIVKDIESDNINDGSTKEDIIDRFRSSKGKQGDLDGKQTFKGDIIGLLKGMSKVKGQPKLTKGEIISILGPGDEYDAQIEKDLEELYGNEHVYSISSGFYIE